VIDVTNIKSPGWHRVVAELSQPLPDDRVFLLRLLSTLGLVSNARQGVLFSVSGSQEQSSVEVKAAQVWPFAADVIDPTGKPLRPLEDLVDPSKLDATTIERTKDVHGAARTVAVSRQLQVFSLDEEQMYTGNQSRGFVIAAPIPSGLSHESGTRPIQHVITLVGETTSRQALQSTLAMVELLIGYVFTHEAQQALRRTRQGTAALDLAGRLIASINATAGSQQGFKAAGFQLVNDLCRQLSLDRAGLGWVPGSPARWPGRGRSEEQQAVGSRREAYSVHLKAISDTEHIDRRLEMCRKIEAAMEECLDQEQPVLFPAPPATGQGADPALAQSVTHAHRDLARNDAHLKVASIPLRVVDARGERIAGVLLVEAGQNAKLDPALVELIQATMDLVSPVLAVRASDDRNLALRAWDSSLRAAAWAVGPKHTVWKVAGIAAMIVTAVLFFGTTTYRVGAPMSLKAQQHRLLAAPVAGVLESIPEEIKSGARVRKGQVLAQLDVKEFQLQELEARAQFAQYDKQADDALRKGDNASASQARARADQARARMELAALNVERASIRSPIDGTIISPDIRERVGSMLKAGDPMIEVADLGTMKIIAKVDDRDIGYIQVGQTGEISPKADPSKTVAFVVDQIVPLSQAEQGVNAFEVRATFVAPEQLSDHEKRWLLPGLEGQAKFNTERRSFAWILSRRIVDQMRVWLWW
jgi:RND family efflux transporter MFP subunit